tara:strand:- start:233 stop:463 length:231 start_codon:yes stop_codon:yes gene_type:complete
MYILHKFEPSNDAVTSSVAASVYPLGVVSVESLSTPAMTSIKSPEDTPEGRLIVKDVPDVKELVCEDSNVIAIFMS